MASEKILNSRLQQKHDIEANWLKATGFIPKAGEIIVYDVDANHKYPRIKIGDGATNVNLLPCIDDVLWEQINTMNYIYATDDENGNVIFGGTPLASAEEGGY